MTKVWLALLGLSLGGVAWGGSTVADLRLRRLGNCVNIRVTARNPDACWRGPVRMELYARPARFGPWWPLKTWAHIPALGPHHKVCRDFFDENSLLLRVLAATGPFEVKAIVSAPGLRGVEQITSL